MSLRRIDAETGEPYTLEMTTELRADLERHRGTTCDHPKTSLRRATLGNGSYQYRYQCATCGQRIGSAVRKTAAPPNCADEDIALRKEYEEKRDADLEAIYQRHIEQQKKAGEGYYEKYKTYLRSELWASKRAKVLKRAKSICEGCLEASATEVHHLSYAHVFDELLYELVALCDACHRKAHIHNAVTELEHHELPCHSCRYGDWDETEGSRCAKFDISTGHALAKGGPCGPNAEELEPLE